MSHDFDGLSFEVAQRLDALCDRFEREWTEGLRPRIESYLPQVADSERPALLKALLNSEFEFRDRAEELFVIEEYVQRFLEFQQVVRQLRDERERRSGSTLAASPPPGDVVAFALSSAELREYVERFEAHRRDDANREALERLLPADTPAKLALLAEILRFVGESGRGFILSRFPELTDAERTLLAAPAQDAAPATIHPFGDSTNAPESLRKPEEPLAADAQLAWDQAQIPPEFRIKKVLGEGAFGRVYLAYEEPLKRYVAVKIPILKQGRPSQSPDASSQEAQAVACLNHPHIVTVYRIGTTADGRVYVVTAYVFGSDLRTLMKQRRFNYEQTARLVATIADALYHAHQRNVFHRDVKPGNILIDERGNPCLLDFGLALREINVDAPGGFVGTPAYTSPEQANRESHLVDGRSDIFSLGAVMYELLTGQRAFPGATASQTLRLVQRANPKPPRQWDAEIPAELERICRRALAKQMADRYSNALDMAADLRGWLAGSSGVAAPPLEDRSSTTGPAATQPTMPVVPRGFRSFDADDSGFFLRLLPGPVEYNGIPRFVWFWKTRIDETDCDRTFRIGLVYGPSGSGKSSAIKAGVLPHLAPSVKVVFVEATAGQTEDRLLKALRKEIPELPDGASLKECVLAARSGRALPAGCKLLIVIDQFEQWLHGRRDYAESELVAALRQCDGGRVQGLLLVRDDFPIMPCMGALQVAVDEGHNSLSVEEFDRDHARKVLTEFGRAYKRLPEAPAPLTVDQEKFLDQSIAELAQDGQIVPVRLIMFAEMCRSRPWTPATLAEVGGAKGIEMRFLNETFSSTHAPRENREHLNAVRGVLGQLLPPSGGKLKGGWRSREELLAASGYAQRPADFEKLLYILDVKLKLVTPVEAEGAASPSADSAAPGGAPPGQERPYQLAHDFLVPAVRDWVRETELKTRRGRAKLLLEERAQEWNQTRQTRSLPSVLESTRIALFTRRRDRTHLQQQTLRAAWKLHARRGLQVVVVLVCTALLAVALMPDNSDPMARFRNRSLPVSQRVAELRRLDLQDSDRREEIMRFLTEEPSPEIVGAVFIRLSGMDPSNVLETLRKIPAIDGERASAWNGQVRTFVDGIPLDQLDAEERGSTIRLMLEIAENSFGAAADRCASRLDGISVSRLCDWLFAASPEFEGQSRRKRTDETMEPLVKIASDQVLLALAEEIQQRIHRIDAEEVGRREHEVAFLLESLALVAPRLFPASKSTQDQFAASIAVVKSFIDRPSQDDEVGLVVDSALMAVAPLCELAAGDQSSLLNSVRGILSPGNGRSVTTRVHAANALSDMHDTGSIAYLVRIAEDRSEAAGLRQSAISALIAIALKVRPAASRSGTDCLDPAPHHAGDCPFEEIESCLIRVLRSYDVDDSSLANEILKSFVQIADVDQADIVFPWLLKTVNSGEAVRVVQEFLREPVQSGKAPAVQARQVDVVVDQFLKWRSENELQLSRQHFNATHPDQALIGATASPIESISDRVDQLVTAALKSRAANEELAPAIRRQAEILLNEREEAGHPDPESHP